MQLIFCLSLLVSRPLFAVPFSGHHMLVAGPSQIAADAVQSLILQKKGNVVDIAVAYGLALSVTSPYFAALGGGGFALVKIKGHPVMALDFREVAPLATHPRFYLEREKTASTRGGAAVGVPGFPAGLIALHEKYGVLPWKKLFEPALKLANEGFRVSGEWVKNTNRAKPYFNEAGKKFFVAKSARPGDLLKQPQLATALRTLRDKKLKGFYTGEVAEDIVKTIKQTGGVLSLKDMSEYKVKWREPIQTDFAGHKIFLMPPPSSGGVVLRQALKLAELKNLKKHKPLSVDELHLFGEIMSRSFRSRLLLGDPEFSPLPLAGLFSQSYLKKAAASIDPKKSKRLPAAESFKGLESSETTHFSLLDSQGNALALTVTLNGNYGSKVVSNRFGIALNNEMDDFTTRPGEPNMFGLVQGPANSVEPGKRPLSSMSPTLVSKDEKVVLSLGSPGGPRIINAVFQVIYRTLVNGWDVDRAIQTPRVHHQFLPHKLFVDRHRFSPEVLTLLADRGHEVVESSVARVYAVQRTSDGTLEAAYDSRGEGGAGGL